jgi:autotransporter-associated beta strand protein
MAPFSWTRWLRSHTRTRINSYRRPRRRQLSLEVLEDRLAPATFTWTGLGGGAGDWSNPKNWTSGGVAAAPPRNGLADLIFPAGAAQLFTHNDFAVLSTGTATFNSITFAGSNYILTGNQITLGDPTVSGSGSLIAKPLVKNVRMNLDVNLAGPGTGRQFIDIGTGSDVTINGQLSGTTGVNLTKEDFGTLVLTNDNSGFIGPITLATNGGIVRITNPNALGDLSFGTTVQANAQLQLSNLSAPVQENLILNGVGPLGDGALLNVAGTNTWAGNIALDSDTTLGSNAGVLDITGQVSDLGAGHNVTKEGPAEIVFASANTYRGSTTINNGILEIQNPQALGTGDGSFATDTVVNTSNLKAGSLQINDPTGVGFTVTNELLILDGDGLNGDGALLNVAGNNTWAGDIILGNSQFTPTNPSIGVNEGTSLTVTGIVKDDPRAVPPAFFNLTVNPTPNGFGKANQPDDGTLIFTSANTYTGATTFVNDGVLQIQDSKGLGGTGCVVLDSGTLALAVDDIPDSVTGTTNTLVVSNPLSITGSGFANQGALHSESGINTYAGTISFAGSVSSIGVDPDPNPTSNTGYFPTFNAAGDAISGDFSLTVLGGLIKDAFGNVTGARLAGNQGTTVQKLGTGQLILPNADGDDKGHGLTTNWDVVQGWVTVRDSHSLDATFNDLDQNLQPNAKVEKGAALHLYPNAGNIDVGENLFLAGQGITHPFGLINQQGAIENLVGDNTVHGNVSLQSQVGVGVENVFGTPSQLIDTGSVSESSPVLTVSSNSNVNGPGNESDTIIDTGSTSGTVTVNYDMHNLGNSLDIYYGVLGQPGTKRIFTTGGAVTGSNSVTVPYGPGGGTVIEIVVNRGGGNPLAAWDYTATVNPTPGQPGGITKVGSQMLVLQADGTYTGPVDIRQGIILDQNNTGLGTGTGTSTSPGVNTTTVEAGAALALASGVAQYNGGIQTGIQVWGERLILNGPGNTTLGTNLAPLSVFGDNSVAGGAVGTIIPTDDMWRGPITLNPGASINVPTNNRVILAGSIDDATTLTAGGAELSKVGGGELVLSGANSYRGTTYVGAGPTGDPLVTEVQQIEVYGTTGTFSLTFNGQTTVPIDFGAIAADVQTKLNALTTIGGVGGSVSVTQTGSYYTIVFGGSLYGINVSQIGFEPLTGGTLAVPSTLSDGSRLSGYFGSLGNLAGGVLTVANSLALGATTSGTIVQNGSSLQLQGNTTVAGESLTIAGSGLTTAPSPPPQTWFDEGPQAVSKSQTLGNPDTASGRITGVSVDPLDPQTIFISTAGGGAWKTSNGGKSWLPLFDNGGPGSKFLFTGAIAVDPNNPLHVYLGTGEADNSADSYYGSGVYESLDGGRTWTLLTGERTYGTPVLMDPDGTADSDGSEDTDADGFVSRTVPFFTEGNNPLNGLAISAIALDGAGTVWVSTSDQAINNPTAGSGNAGIWRFDPVAPGDTLHGHWFQMTAADVTSDERLGLLPAGNSGFPAAPPDTAGPDDEWKITFPDKNAVYSDIKFDPTGVLATPTLYMALGTPFGDVNNALFRCDNPYEFVPRWYIGDANLYPGHGTYAAGGGGRYATNIDVPALRNGNIKIAFNAANPNIIYGVDTDPFSQGILDIQRSTDFGQTWRIITAPPLVTDYLNNPVNYQGNQGYYDSAALVDANDRLYVAGEWGVLYTPNAGAAWVPFTKDSAGNAPAANFHALALRSDGLQLFAGTDGGIWGWDTTLGNPNSGDWTDLNSNLATALANSVAGIPGDPTHAYVSTQASGTDQFNNVQPWPMVDDDGSAPLPRFDDVQYPSPYGSSVAVNPNSPSTVYAWIQDSQVAGHPDLSTLRESTDGGKTWNDVLWNDGDIVLSGAQNPVLVVDPVNTNRVLIGDNLLEINPVFGFVEANPNLMQSLDGGLTWSDLLAPTSPTAVAVASYIGPSDPVFGNSSTNVYDPNTVYTTDGVNVFVTNDLGTHWTPPFPQMGNRTPAPVSGSISDIEVDPRSRNTAFVSSSAAPGTLFGGGPIPRVMMTTNGGTTWKNLTGVGSTALPAVPVWKLVLDPRTGYLYAGTDQGVYWTASVTSPSWQPLGSGLANVQVKDMVLDESLNTLTVASYGRSAYTIFLNFTQANAGAFNAVSGTGVWTGPVILSGATTIGAASTLGIAGQALQIGSNTASLNIVGTISDQVPGANYRLTKKGFGDVIFSGASTYGGVTEVQQGALVVHNPQALGSTVNGTIVDPGQVLELQTDLDGETVHLNGDGINFNGHNTGALYNVSNFNTFTGTLVLDTSSTVGVASGSQLTIASPGTITDGGLGHTLTKELTGTLVLAGSDSYGTGSAAAPSTFVDQGALNVQNAGALGVPGNLTQVLDGAQLQLSGGVTVPASQSLWISGTGINSTGALEGVGGANDWQGPVILATDPGFNPPTSPPTSVGIGALMTNPADTLTIDGVIGGPLGIVKLDAGTVVFNNANTYGGLTDVQAGALRIENPKALGTAFSLADGTVVEAGAALELDGDPKGTGASLTVPVENLILNGTGAPTVQTVTVNGTAGSFTLTFNGQTTSALPFNASAAQVQAQLNRIAGAGALVSVLSEQEPTGTVYTVVFGGSLTSADQPQMIAIATGGTTAVVSTARHGATGALRNYIGNNTWAAPIILQTGSDLGADPGTTLTVTGGIRDAIPASVPAPSLTKVGAGTVVFTNANTYTGPTVVNQGILNVQDPGALGSVVSEQQSVTLSGPLTGFFTLTFNGVTTPKLSADTTSPSFSTSVMNALNKLSTIGGVGGVVSVSPPAGSTFTVTFGGTLANQNLPQMKGAGFGGTQANVSTVRDGSSGTTVNAGGTLQVQGSITVSTEPLTLTGTGTSAVQEFSTTGGPFTLSFNGSPPVSLAAGASADDVAAALNAMPTIKGVGGSVAVAVTNGVYTVTFGGKLAGVAQPDMTGTNLGPVVNVTPEPDFSQQVALAGAPGGGFTLTFNGSTTTTLPVGASALAVQNALNALSSVVGAGGTAAVTLSGGVYTVVFGGSLGGAAQPPMTGIGAVSTVTPGGLGALDSPSGTNTWDNTVTLGNTVTLAGATWIGSDTDTSGATPVPSTLTINNAIGESVTASTLTKVGSGIVQFTGSGISNSNTYTGTTTVADGTLQLNKSGGATAVGNVVVGDGLPNPSVPLSDVLQLIGSNQMPTTAAVTVNSDGLFDLNGQKQAIGSLTMTGGTVSISGSLAMLTLNGDITAATDSTGAPATIQDLGTLELGSTAHKINVAGPVGIYADLIISAPVDGTATSSVTKTGPGTVAFAADNTFAGLTTINQGIVIADGDPAHGNTLAAVSLGGGTLAGNGAVGTVTSGALGGAVTGGDPAPIPPGTLTINTTATSPTAVLNSKTKYLVGLNTLLDGPSSLLIVNGPAGFTGNVLDLNGATLAGAIDPAIGIGDSFTIVTTNNGTITGKLAEQPGDPGVIFLDGKKFTVQYLPAGAPTEVVLTRALAVATVSLTSSADPSVFGQDPTFTAVVTPEPGSGGVSDSDTVAFTLSQGTTTILSETLNLSGGKAVFDPQAFGVYPLAVGSYTVTATFNADGGDPTFAPASATPVTQVVNPALTTINLSSSPPSPIPLQPVTVTATVVPVAPGAGVPNGSVTFTLDGVAVPGSFALSGGVTTVTLTGLTASLHRVRATFTDSDGNFQNFSTTDDFLINVVKGNPTVSVSSSPTSSVFGQSATFTATVAGLAGLTPTGTVDFYDGATILANHLGGGTLSGGVFTVSTSALALGTHTINVTYSGDISYNPAAGALTSFVVSVSPTTTTLTSSLNPSGYLQTVTFAAVVAPTGGGAGTPTGAVSFFDGGTLLGTSTITVGGTALLFINSLTVGAHSITANYLGSTNFSPSTSSPPLVQIVKAASTITITSSANPSVFGQVVTLSAKVKAPNPLTNVPPDGETVSFYDGPVSPADLLGTVPLAGGLASVSTAFAVGTHTITVTYGGDTVFLPGSNTFTQTVNRDATTTTVKSGPSPSVYGQPLVFTATVLAKAPGAGLPTGTVNFYDGTVTAANLLGSNTLDASGTTTVTPSRLLTAGTHTIIAVYADDTNFAASQGNTAQVINKTASITTITSGPDNPSVFGEPVVLTATVAASGLGGGNATGKVTFWAGAVGTGTIVGTGTLSTTASVTTARITLNSLSVGSHTFNASYAGDGNFLGSNTAATGASIQVVNKDTTTTTVSSSANPSVVGTPVTFTAAVTADAPGSGVPAGTVTFFDNGKSLGAAKTLAGGKATFVISTLAPVPATHSITATYSGSTNYIGGTSAPLTQAVVFADTVTAGTSLNPSTYGQSVTLSATVAPVGTGFVPTGTVDFFVGTTDISGPVTLTPGASVATTTFTTSLLPGGTDSITVHYSGDGNFIHNVSKALSQVVNKDGSTVSVSASTSTSIYGLPVTFTAVVSPKLAGSPGVPGGTVIFWDGPVNTGKKLGGATLSGGVATLTVTTLGAMPTPLLHNVNVSYAGDGNYTASNTTSAAQVTVSQSTTQTTISGSLTSSVFGQAVTFNAVVTALTGGGVPNGNVAFFDDGSATPIATVALDATGTATLVLTTQLGAGSHDLTATYLGNNNYAGSESLDDAPLTVSQAATSVALTSSANPSGLMQPVTFTAKVLPVAPGSGTPTGTVTFMDGGLPIGTVNVVGGQALLVISSLTLGDHTITASYGGDTNFTGNTSSSLTQTVQFQAVASLRAALPKNPKGVTTGTGFTLTVTALDFAGKQVFADFDPVSIVLVSAPLAGTLSGKLSGAFVNGVATFNGLVVNKAGNYTVRIRGSGLTINFVITASGRQT